MPGIKTLGDKAFMQAFQVTDRVIQNNHPLFMLVWPGSAVALIVCAASGFSTLEGVHLWLLLVATVAYIGGVQVATVVVHLPLNNALQDCDLESMSPEELRAARNDFEPRWNTANRIRTAIACVVALLLVVVALLQ